VGGEGQLYAGAIGGVAVALTAPGDWPQWLFVITTSVGGILAGAFWGSLTALAKVVADANEVIVGLMLSFVAIILSSYLIRVTWAQGISPQTRNIPGNANLPVIWSAGLVTIGVLFAIAVVIGAWVFLHHTSMGFQVRAVGLNEGAARLAGSSVKKVTLLTFAVGGGCAGLAGAVSVTGINHALINNFSNNWGLLGIAVALVARLEPLWIIPAAFLFAALQVGSNGLDVTLGLSSSLGQVIITVFIVALMYFRLVRTDSFRAGL
jgi:simple sugar transport system permease protein